MTIPDYFEMVMHWSQLHELKHLEMLNSRNTLHLMYFHHGFEKTVRGLLELQQFKQVNFLFYSNNNTSANSIVKLIKGLPSLERIMFNCSTIRLSEIMNILKYSEHL